MACEHRFICGKFMGKKCGKPIVSTEKFCNICILKEMNNNEVSEKFKKFRKEVRLMFPYPNGWFICHYQDFVVEFDGEFHLKGMTDSRSFNPTKETLLKEPTEDDKIKASKYGILSN